MARTIRRESSFVAICLGAAIGFGGSSVLSQQPNVPEWVSECLVTRREVNAGDIPQHKAEVLRDAESVADARSTDTLAKQSRIVERWEVFLGINSLESSRTNDYSVVRREELGGVSRQLIEYESEIGERVQAYVLQPLDSSNREKRPGIVAFHPTTDLNIDEIAGILNDGPRATAFHFARNGYIVICPKCFLWKERISFAESAEKFLKSHPGSLGMAKMLHDAKRAVDILESLPGVDASRIGAFGHSLGAKESFYLAAFDRRIRSTVASEGGILLESTNWDAPWYLGEVVRQPGFHLRHEELIELISPRPFLVIAGESGKGAADGEKTRKMLEATVSDKKLFGDDRKSMFAVWNHRNGHVYEREQLDRTLDWMSWSLRREPSER